MKRQARDSGRVRSSVKSLQLPCTQKCHSQPMEPTNLRASRGPKPRHSLVPKPSGSRANQETKGCIWLFSTAWEPQTQGLCRRRLPSHWRLPCSPMPNHSQLHPPFPVPSARDQRLSRIPLPSTSTLIPAPVISSFPACSDLLTGLTPFSLFCSSQIFQL